MSDIPVLTKRRLQADVIQPIYQELVSELGEERAQQILDSAIRKSALAEAAEFASRAPAGGTSLRTFIELFDLWTAGGALEVEIQTQTDQQFDFDVTRCRYAEAYQEMGIGHIGHLLSCNRDGAFCEGYDANIKLLREDTIMNGASRCTFRYRYEGDKT
jgi:hypothetical protein